MGLSFLCAVTHDALRFQGLNQATMASFFIEAYVHQRGSQQLFLVSERSTCVHASQGSQACLAIPLLTMPMSHVILAKLSMHEHLVLAAGSSKQDRTPIYFAQAV